MASGLFSKNPPIMSAAVSWAWQLLLLNSRSTKAGANLEIIAIPTQTMNKSSFQQSTWGLKDPPAKECPNLNLLIRLFPHGSHNLWDFAIWPNMTISKLVQALQYNYATCSSVNSIPAHPMCNTIENNKNVQYFIDPPIHDKATLVCYQPVL